MAFSTTGGSHAEAAGVHAHGATAPARTAKAVAFHDEMRALWETHGWWTRSVIVSFADERPNLSPELNALLQNQVDIGDAVKPYYGRAAGNTLTKLLKKHILGAAALLEATKSGDPSRLAQAKAAWFANGRQIADFLHAANPKFVPRAATRAAMRTHLDQVIVLAVAELQGEHAANVRLTAPSSPWQTRSPAGSSSSSPSASAEPRGPFVRAARVLRAARTHARFPPAPLGSHGGCFSGTGPPMHFLSRDRKNCAAADTNLVMRATDEHPWAGRPAPQSPNRLRLHRLPGTGAGAQPARRPPPDP